MGYLQTKEIFIGVISGQVMQVLDYSVPGRAFLGICVQRCPRCAGGGLELGSRFFTKQCQCITDLPPS